MWILTLLACAERIDEASREEVCARYASSTCTRAVECNTTFTDPAICADRTLQLCCTSRGTCDEIVDAAPWDECVADVSVAPCETFRTEEPASCEALTPGF